MEVKKIVEGMTAPEVAQVIDENFKALNNEKANKSVVDAKFELLVNMSNQLETEKADKATTEENFANLEETIATNKESADTKLSELGSKVGFKQLREFEFVSDYQTIQLDPPIYAGQIIDIEGDVDDLNFYNEMSGTNYRIFRHGFAPVQLNYVRSITTHGISRVNVQPIPYKNSVENYCIKSISKNVYTQYGYLDVENVAENKAIISPFYIIRDEDEDKITLSKRIIGYQIIVEFYDKNFVSLGDEVSISVGKTIDIPSACKYMQFKDYKREIIEGGTMVNYGSEILDYEPFVTPDNADIYYKIRGVEEDVKENNDSIVDVYNIAKEGKEKADALFEKGVIPFSETFNFTYAYHYIKLPYPIYPGQRVFVDGDIKTLNFYNDLEGTSNTGYNQKINDGEVSLELATYVRCESNIGTCTITTTKEEIRPVKPVKNLHSNYYGNLEGLSDTAVYRIPTIIEREASQTKITMSKRAKGLKLFVVFLDGDFKRIQTISEMSYSQGTSTIDIPSNCRYFYFYDYVSELKEGVTMVNYGSEILDYEPFSISETYGIYKDVTRHEKEIRAIERELSGLNPYVSSIIREPLMISSTKENLLYINDAIISNEEFRVSMHNTHYSLANQIGFVKNPSQGEKSGTLKIATNNSVYSESVVSKSNKAPQIGTINILDIGSSYIDLGHITSRQKENYEADGIRVNLIGTMSRNGSQYEAKSGGTWNFLLKPLGRAVILDVNGVTSLPYTGYPGTTYQDSNGVKWTVRGVMIKNGSGKLVLSSFDVDVNYGGSTGNNNTDYDVAAQNLPSAGTLTKTSNDSTGTTTSNGDSTIQYSSKELVYYNPFWNPTTNELDFSYYIEKWGFNAPDIISLTFGSNDLGGSEMQSDSTVSYVTDKAVQVVQKIHEEYPNCKILLTTSCYGYEGSSYNEHQVVVRKYNLQKYYLSLVEKMGVKTEYADYVAIVPTLFMIDRLNGFATKEVQPCSLYDYKFVMSDDMVHPNSLGFYQYADAMLGYAYKLLNKYPPK